MTTLTSALGAGMKALLGASDNAGVAIQPAVLHGTGVQSIPVPGVGRVLVQRVEPGSVRPFGEQAADASTGSQSIGLLNDHRHVRHAIAEPAPAAPASNVIGDSTSWDMISS